MYKKITTRQRRALRVRRSLKAYNKSGKVRLSVHRSNANIYAQLIDDSKGSTIASASTLERGVANNGGNIEAAINVGKLIAQRASEAGIKEVVFDRGAFLYHGRLKALAEAARENGLKF